MGCLGALGAVEGAVIEKLRSLPPDQRVDYWAQVSLDSYYPLDKSWDAMHRALTDRHLEFGDEHAPGCWVVLGGERLYGGLEGEWDHVIVCKSPEQVRAVASWLGAVTAERFSEWYYAIDPEEYGMQPDEWDCGYTWDFFYESLEFWQNAAKKGLYVVFAASQ